MIPRECAYSMNLPAIDRRNVVPNRHTVHLQAGHVVEESSVIVDDITPRPNASVLNNGRFGNAEFRQGVKCCPPFTGPQIRCEQHRQLLVEFFYAIEDAGGIGSCNHDQPDIESATETSSRRWYSPGVRRQLTRPFWPSSAILGFVADVPTRIKFRSAIRSLARGKDLQDVGQVTLHHALKFIDRKLLDAFVRAVEQSPPNAWIAKRYAPQIVK